MARRGRPKKVRSGAAKLLAINMASVHSCEMLKAYAIFSHQTMGEAFDELIASSPKLHQLLEDHGGVEAAIQQVRQLPKRGRPVITAGNLQQGAPSQNCWQPQLRMVDIPADSPPQEQGQNLAGSFEMITVAPEKIRLVSVEEAARLMNLGRTHVYMLVLHRELQSVKIGRTRRVVVSSIDAYIQRLLEQEAQHAVS